MDSLGKEINQILRGSRLGTPEEEGVAKEIATQEILLKEDIAKKAEEVSSLESTVISIQKEIAELRALAEKNQIAPTPIVTPVVIPGITPAVPTPKVAFEASEFVKKNWLWLLLGGGGAITAIILVARKK